MKYILLLMCCIVIAAENTVAEEDSIMYFDMGAWVASNPGDTVLHYDALKMTAALQGIVNRDTPHLLIRFLEGEGASGPINTDDYWLEIIRNRWQDMGVVKKENSMKEMLKKFNSFVNGWVVWDPAVPATANVAATICGVENLLPIRAGSPLFDYLKEQGVDIAVKKSLVGLFDGSESGSAKCDAYLWAKREYLDTGKCHPALMAFYIDGYTQQPEKEGFHYDDLPNTKVANHDYYIANRAFFMDLLIWSDETPVDDPEQPLGTDYNTLVKLLEAQYKRSEGKAFTCIGGFVSWNLKYTNYGFAGGSHEPVATEWQYISLFGAHNAILDADALGLACLPNTSAYRHYPLRKQYTQHKRPVPQPLENKTYVLIYMGDYDSAAWLSRSMPRVWDDPARGEIPIAWAFNPNLSDRVPYVFDHIYETASPNDWFIGGDSGAGYLNPNLLIGDRLGSGLPDALDLWVEHNRRYYEKFDYDITGFVINGFSGDMPLRIQEAYSCFSPKGVGMQLGFEKARVNDTPFIRHNSDISPRTENMKEGADQMASFCKADKPQFLVFRWILQTPTTLKNMMTLLDDQYPEQNWEFCDPYTFFDLYRKHLENIEPAEKP
ncbi:MAG: hypothetical protein KAH38_05280 [Candidatus Hydrogenedentes bacterium]|nr:hypothetical protein [Candidatus Hydrogenedentota bacterium]